MLKSHKTKHVANDQLFNVLLSDLTLRLLKVNPRNIDSEIRQSVEEIGEYLGVDRVELRKFSGDRSATTLLHWWVRSNEIGLTANIPNEEMPWAAPLILKGEVVRIGRLSDMPPEAASGRTIMERDGLRAALLVPHMVNDEIYGALALASQQEREWSDQIAREARLIGEALAHAYERAQLHNSLLTSDARLRAVVQNQSEFIVRWLPDGTRSWVNDAYCKFLQRSRESLIGTSFLPRLRQVDRRKLLSKVMAMTPEHSAQTEEHQVLLSSGETGWHRWTDKGIFDDSGNLVEIQSIGFDITDRKRAEQALAESETRYRNLVEYSYDWIWEMNLEFRHTYSNRQLEVILEYTADEMGELPLSQLYHPDDWLAVQERLPDLIDKKTGWNDWVLRFRHKDGSYRYLQSNATPVFDADGELCAFRGIGRDVSDAEKVRQEISRRAEFQERLAVLSNRLLTSPVEETQERVYDALGQIGIQYDLFSIGIWWFAGPQGEVGELFTRWRRDDQTWPDPGEYKPQDLVPWFANRMRCGEFTQIDDVSDMPDEARADQASMQKWGMSSVLGFPASAEQRQSSSCFVVTSSDLRKWDEDTIQELRLLADTFTGACIRHRATSEVAHRARFQRRLASLSAGLLTSSIEDTEAGVHDALSQIGIDYDLYSIGLWWFSDDSGGQITRYAGWVSGQGSRPLSSGPVPNSRVPWFTKQVMKSQVVQIDDINDMPDEARIDQATFRGFGALSLLALPAHRESEVVGCCICNSSEQRHWDEKTVQELHLLANAVVGATARVHASEVRKRREQDLNRSQSVGRLGSFSLIVDDGLSGFPTKGKLEVSPQFCELFDIDAEEATVELTTSRFHPDDAQRIYDRVGQCMRSGTEFHEIYRVVRTDGTVIHVEDRTVYEADETGRVKRIFGTAQDVTDKVEAKKKIENALAEIERLKDQLHKENLYLREEVRVAHGFDKIVGKSPQLKKALNAVEKIAPTDIPVLILGETGTGKELIAQAIHDLSGRKDKALISINCAALSRNLVESELFGHEKGAFTGAHSQRKGRFELADGGTLFLDEIGDLEWDLQAKLLRVLQEGEFERLGGSKTMHADVRLIAATNKNLLHAADKGEFRADLYYRINSFPIELPPLRDRVGDLPALTQYLAQKHAKRMGKEIASVSARTIRYITQQNWPGNVRELEGFIQRALISTSGPVLDYLEAQHVTTRFPAAVGSVPADEDAVDLRVAESQHILKVLNNTQWVIGGKCGAASKLGVAPSTLRSKMKRLGIERTS